LLKIKSSPLVGRTYQQQTVYDGRGCCFNGCFKTGGAAGGASGGGGFTAGRGKRAGGEFKERIGVDAELSQGRRCQARRQRPSSHVGVGNQRRGFRGRGTNRNLRVQHNHAEQVGQGVQTLASVQGQNEDRQDPVQDQEYIRQARNIRCGNDR